MHILEEQVFKILNRMFKIFLNVKFGYISAIYVVRGFIAFIVFAHFLDCRKTRVWHLVCVPH